MPLMGNKIGILLTNLGTPDEPTPMALRRYLREFLWDRRVVDLPRWKWWPILHGIVLRSRPKKSARLYEEIWTAEGSPLFVTTRRQCQLIQEYFDENNQPHVSIEMGMRYGQPSIERALEALYKKGCRHLVLLPLYPQFSVATTGSTFDAVAETFKKWRDIFHFRMIKEYFDHPAYILALSQSIEGFWLANSRPQKLLFSFHGIPQRYADEGDPYPLQCQTTASLVAKKLGLREDEWLMSYQSRFGKEEWLKPYTDATLESLPSNGVVNVQVICPGFSSDCLETLQEIEIENRALFLGAGGEKYRYIPALNVESLHIQALIEIINRELQGWLV